MQQPVRPPKADDGAAFGKHRSDLQAQEGAFPRMTDDDLQLIIEGPPRSVKFLQNLLYSVYEDRRLRNDRYTKNDLVTFDDIARFVHRRSNGEGIRFS